MARALVMRIVRAKWFAPLCLFALALFVRVVPIFQHSFDGLYGQDAYAYFEYARELFAALSQARVPPPFWWSLGYPFLLDAAFLFGGTNAASAQGITMLGGALVAPLAYLMAREAADAACKNIAGWVAGLICALSGQLVQSSVVVMSDAPALMWATLAAWLLLRYARTRGIWNLIFAALAVGLAVWTRWQNLLFAGVWFSALVTIEWNSTAKEWNSNCNKKSKPPTGGRAANGLGHFILGLAVIGLVLLPQMLLTVTTNAPLAGSSWLEGWSPANFFARTFDNVDGHFEYALPVALFYAQAVAHPAYLFVMLTPLFGVGVAVLLKRMRRWKHHRTLRAETILLLGWIAAMLVFLMGIPYENFRFSLGFLTPLAVVTGIGAGWLWTRWQTTSRRVALSAWIAIALLVMLTWQPRVLAPVLEIHARELAHARWLEAELGPNALLYTMELDGAVRYYTQVRVINLWNMERDELNRIAPTYLYVDTNKIRAQWRGRLPEQLLGALSETNALHRVGDFDGWTLYRVGDCGNCDNCTARLLDCE